VEGTLETLSKLLESNVTRVRNDLRMLSRKLDNVETNTGLTAHGHGHAVLPSPRHSSLQPVFLPPAGHRSMPPLLALDTDLRRQNFLEVAIPLNHTTTNSSSSANNTGFNSARSKHLAMVLPSELFAKDIEESGAEMSAEDEEENNDEASQAPGEDSQLEEEVVTLNVGGRVFQTYRQTLLRFPESLLGVYVNSEHFAKERR
jgi:hypothetical protein